MNCFLHPLQRQLLTGQLVVFANPKFEHTASSSYCEYSEVWDMSKDLVLHYGGTFVRSQIGFIRKKRKYISEYEQVCRRCEVMPPCGCGIKSLHWCFRRAMSSSLHYFRGKTPRAFCLSGRGFESRKELLIFVLGFFLNSITDPNTFAKALLTTIIVNDPLAVALFHSQALFYRPCLSQHSFLSHSRLSFDLYRYPTPPLHCRSCYQLYCRGD